MIESDRGNTERRNTQIIESKGDTNRAKLEEKYFRRIEKFDGNIKELRGWMFNIEVALGQVDKELSNLVREIIRRDDIQRFPDSCNPREDHLIDRVIYDKYSSELYEVL
eukprot:9719520-Karenia_brevis.AAC.1